MSNLDTYDRWLKRYALKTTYLATFGPISFFMPKFQYLFYTHLFTFIILYNILQNHKISTNQIYLFYFTLILIFYVIAAGYLICCAKRWDIFGIQFFIATRVINLWKSELKKLVKISYTFYKITHNSLSHIKALVEVILRLGTWIKIKFFVLWVISVNAAILDEGWQKIFFFQNKWSTTKFFKNKLKENKICNNKNPTILYVMFYRAGRWTFFIKSSDHHFYYFILRFLAYSLFFSKNIIHVYTTIR